MNVSTESWTSLRETQVRSQIRALGLLISPSVCKVEDSALDMLAATFCKSTLTTQATKVIRTTYQDNLLFQNSLSEKLQILLHSPQQ